MYLKRKKGFKRKTPPNMTAEQTFKYIYHITKQIEAGTAIPQHWRFLNDYADAGLVEALRKMVLKRMAGAPAKNPLDKR